MRKYYRATPAGRRTLSRAQAQLAELVDEVLPATEDRQRPVRSGIRKGGESGRR
jgi:DNA-binding PadR family transcriptional regulator